MTNRHRFHESRERLFIARVTIEFLSPARPNTDVKKKKRARDIGCVSNVIKTACLLRLRYVKRSFWRERERERSVISISLTCLVQIARKYFPLKDSTTVQIRIPLYFPLSEFVLITAISRIVAFIPWIISTEDIFLLSPLYILLLIKV